MSELLVLSVVACPIVLAGLLSIWRAEDRSRAIGAIATASTLVLAAVAMAVRTGGSPELPGLDARVAFALDGGSLVLVPLFAGIALVAVVAMPRRVLDRRGTIALLLSLGAVAGTACATNLLVLVLFFSLGALAPLVALSGPRATISPPRAARRLVIASSTIGIVAALATVVAVGWLSSRSELASALELDAIGTGLSPAAATVILGLAACAALTRMAIYPFQSWLPALIDEAPLLVPAAVAGDVGVVLLLRVALPIVHHALPAAAFVLATLALLAALRSAVAALGQKRAGGIIACVASSHLASMFAAFVTRTEESLTGALVEVVAVGVGTTGLFALLAAVEARVGKGELGAHGRLGRAMPRAALAWFVFSFALVGFPGTLSFVAEDLVIHGLLLLHPAASAAFIAASVMNALALFRGGATLFLGPGPERPTVPDLLVRERVIVAVLVVATIGAGFVPGGLVSLSQQATISLAREVERAGTPRLARD